jgi:predicted ATPase
LLRGYFSIQPGQTETESASMLQQSVEKVMGAQAENALPYLEYLLSIKPSNPTLSERIRYLDAGQLRQQIFLTVRDLLIAEARRQPLLIILEDLHWADEASMDLLTYLLDLVRQESIIIYIITRPFQGGALSKIVDWADKHLPGQYHFIRLPSLSEAQSTHLLISLLTIPDLPEDLRFMILKRSAGIPFYLEEILRMLIDKGILQHHNGKWHVDAATNFLELGVPDTLQGLILARFDRLSAEQRRLLQIASVIGNQFRLDLLERLIPNKTPTELSEILTDLVDKDYLLKDSEFSDRYVFRHVLMSEAIYQTLLKRERSSLHGQVGEGIETLYPHLIEEQVELLARHFSWSDRTERALYYLIRAGKKSAASFVSEQAQQHFLQALLLLPKTAHTQEQEWDIHSGLGDVLTLLGDYHTANEHFMAALAICNNEGDGSYARMSALHRKIARTLERQGMYDQALKFLDDARQSLSVDSPDGKMEMAQVLNDTGWINYRLGKFPEAEQLLNNALSLVENSNELDAIASIYNRLGGLAYNQGDWNKTSEYLRKSIAIRDSIGDVVGLANSMNNLALLAIEIGDYPTALENLTRSYELKKRLGQAEGISTALNNIAWLRIQRGEITEAQECLAQALDLARQIGYTMLEGQVLKNYGEMHLEAQKWEAARKSLREAVFIFESLGAHDQLIDTYRLLGEAALGIGNINEGQSCADSIQAMTVSLNDGTRELSSIQRGEFWRFRGMLATHQGDWDSAAHFLNESEQIFRVLGVRLYQGRAAMQLGRLAETRGDMYTALHRYREAELLFRSVGASAAEERSHRAAQRQSA